MALPNFKNKESSPTPRQARVVTNLLILHIPPNWPENQAPVAWWWRDKDGRLQVGEVLELEDLPPAALSARVHVWTPGADTVLTTATLPTRARAKILQALPFALEEQILGEPESMHFAYRPLGDGRLAVAITARERLQLWLAKFAGVGLQVVSMCPVILALPHSSESWSLATTFGEEMAVRTDAFSGFTCTLSTHASPAILLAALREARAQQRAPMDLRIINASPDFDANSWSDVGLPAHTITQDFLGQADNVPLNLLQSDFSHLGQLRQLVSKLRPAAIMLTVWVVLSLGFNTWQWWHLSRLEKVQQAQMLGLFHQTFPGAKVVIDPALQMQRNYAAIHNGAAGPNDLLPLLEKVARTMQSQPQLKLQEFQYSDSALTLNLNVPDFQALESVKNAFSTAGLHIEVLSATSRANTVDGRLRLSAGGMYEPL